MVKVTINNQLIGCLNSPNYEELTNFITKQTNLDASDYYLEQNGKRITWENNRINHDINYVRCIISVKGGKGGFGSMLRAIGAQIEKTTNKEACRDLNGRRLRDINEEKRLKNWLEKQVEREQEAEERKRRKVEKLLTLPKHDFKDEKYEEARSKLAEKVNNAVEEGFKKAENATKIKPTDSSNGNGVGAKRKIETMALSSSKKKCNLWIGDDISDTDDSDDSTDDEKSNNYIKKKTELTVKISNI